VSTEEELAAAFEAAMGNTTSPTLIEVRLDKYDCSERLKQLTAKLKRRVR
jgi:TPP-dependent 2-oxoacid decarboxylase